MSISVKSVSTVNVSYVFSNKANRQVRVIFV